MYWAHGCTATDNLWPRSIAAMPYLIGTDEAGYGPNLGPLVISASVWWVDDSTARNDLYQRLKRDVCKSHRAGGSDAPRGDRRFQGSVLAGAGPGRARTRRAGGAGAWSDRCPDRLVRRLAIARRALARPLARACPGTRITTCACRWRPTATTWRGWCRGCGAVSSAPACGWWRCAAAPCFPTSSIASTCELGNKAEALSRFTLELVADMLALCAGEPVVDRVRQARRAQLLRPAVAACSFPIRLIEVHAESSRAQRLSLGSERGPHRGPLSRRRRRLSAGRPGLDDLEVSARAGHAGLQRFLVHARAGSRADGRLSARRPPVQERHRAAATGDGNRRSDRVAQIADACSSRIRNSPCCSISCATRLAGPARRPALSRRRLATLDRQGTQAGSQGGQETRPPRIRADAGGHQSAGALPADGRGDLRARSSAARTRGVGQPAARQPAGLSSSAWSNDRAPKSWPGSAMRRTSTNWPRRSWAADARRSRSPRGPWPRFAFDDAIARRAGRVCAGYVSSPCRCSAT